MTRFVLFVWLGAVSVSPVFGQSAAERQLAADIRILEQRTERIEGSVRELAQATQELNKQLSDQANAIRKLSADNKVVIEEALTTVGVLREQLAATNQQLATLLEKSAAPVGTMGLFENARADYMAGNYLLAVQGVTANLSASPQASNAALAQYYVGEAYRLDRKPNEALAAYDRLIAGHATSDQIPNARVRRAEVLNELGRVEEARTEYGVVMKDWPNTDAATLAKQRLATLGRAASPRQPQ
jgi:TolA-binding protein